MDRPSQTYQGEKWSPSPSKKSPSKSPDMKRFNVKEYEEHQDVDALNQVFLHHLGMEELVKLYSRNHEMFETREALATLAKRFKLPYRRGHIPKSFAKLLEKYDEVYATVRSYNNTNDPRLPKDIFVQAASEGNIEAMIEGLKRYPDLQGEYTLNEALEVAARGGHEVIIDLLLDLGATSKNNEIAEGAIRGGHFDILLNDKYIKYKKTGKEYYLYLLRAAVDFEQLEVLKYLFEHPDPRADSKINLLNRLMISAGSSGSEKSAKYLIKEGATNYQGLVESALYNRNFDLMMKYWDKFDPSRVDSQEFDKAFYRAAEDNQIDVLKFLYNKGVITQKMLNNTLRDVFSANKETLRNLRSLGAVDEDSNSSSEESSD